MSSFPTKPPADFDRPGAVITRPQEITCFSFDKNHEIRHDSSGIKYYYTPEMNVNLSEGFEQFQKLDDEREDEHIDALLASIIELEKKKDGERVEADFVTWRGMMTKIMTTPYSPLDSFEMNATYFQGTIYIEESHAFKLASRQKEKESRRPRPPHLPSPELMSYWGYKFETLCMLPDTWDNTSRDYIENRPNLVVNNHEQYCSVVTTAVGGMNVVIGGEVDGVWDVKQEDPNFRTNWVELKTSAEIKGEDDVVRFERKLNKFWAQSFLLGVPKIIVGFRTNDRQGRLVRVREFDTTKIPAMVRNEGRGLWKSNVCINFLSEFLARLKDTIKTEEVWKIRRTEKSPVIEIFSTNTGTPRDILSQDFIDWRIPGAEWPE